MSSVGDRDQYVDTQDISLTLNIPPSIFTQLTNVKLNRERDVTTHYLTDDTIERVANLEIPSIEGDVVLTVPQVIVWDALLITEGDGTLPLKTWTLTYTSQSDDAVSYNLLRAKLTQFYLIDLGLGAATHHFVIEGEGVSLT